MYQLRSLDMNDCYIIYRCKTCHKHFILMTNEVEHSEKESRYITCPYFGRHKDITVVGRIDRYGEIKKCMEERSYKKVSGAIRQK